LELPSRLRAESPPQSPREITVEFQPSCINCGAHGDILYRDLHDRVSHAPGIWSLVRCENRSCGLIWLSPRPVSKDLWKAYTQYYTHYSPPPESPRRRFHRYIRTGYLANSFEYHALPASFLQRWLGMFASFLPNLRARLDFSVMWLRGNKVGRVLEVGCGRGDNLNFLKEAGWTVEGIDSDVQAVAICQARRLTVRHGTLQEQTYQAETFDAVVMSHVIEHVFDPSQTIRECHRILKPGGTLAMLTPNSNSLGHRLYGSSWLHLDPPRHLHLFNRTTLTGLARGLSFRRLHCFAVLRDANWTLGASRQIRKVGSYRLGVLPFSLRLYGLFLLYIEWIALFFSKDIGEEIVLIAEKDQNAPT
jgi:SAM-dependent methyltransferase